MTMNTTSTRLRKAGCLIVSAAIVVTALVGCGGEQPPPKPSLPTGVERFHATFVWYPSEHLDYTTPMGTMVRAMTESHQTFDAIGIPGFFPGRQNADRSFVSNPSRVERWSARQHRLEWAGTYHLWVLGVRPIDARTEQAAVCMVMKQVGRRKVGETGPYQTNNAWGLQFPAITKGKTPPPANQTGPARRPSRSMFGDWTFDHLGSGLPDWPRHVLDAYSEQCRLHALQFGPGHNGLTPLPLPVPTQPPQPGWPRSGL